MTRLSVGASVLPLRKDEIEAFDDPYERVSFDPTVSGNYRIRIQRFSNNDAASKFHMGLAVDWN